jgi:tRNA(fMet)-specific endonuclease VapC
VSLRFLIDTDILIYLRQRRSLQVVARFRAVQAGDAAMSVITHGELLYGAERSRERERSLKSVSDLTSLVPVLALPEDTGIEYGRIRAELEGRGIPIGNNAKVAGLTLVTNNEKEFRRISGLKIENWASKK